jgi:predicted nucleic acid-binding protein
LILVLDASVAVMLAVLEAGSPAARALVTGAAPTAPELILAEVANALWRKVRTKAIGREEALAALPLLRRLIDPLVPLRELEAQALDLALRRDHPAHDCFYVALAMREAVPLLTADRRLAERFADAADIRLIAG